MTIIQLGTLLRQYRINAQIEQKELATELGYSHASTVSRFESNRRTVSKEYLQRFIEFFDLSSKEAQKLWELQVEKTTALPESNDNYWIEAPDVDLFHGRADEVALLKQWIVDEQCRVVGIFGMGGIGKTMLASKVGWEIRSQFTIAVWCSLLNAPPLAETLALCFEALGCTTEKDASLSQQIRQLLILLQEQRCLLVFDNTETILQANTNQTGRFLPGYERYGQLFRYLGESRHQSCILITSREQPREITRLVGINGYVRTMTVRGLTAPEGQLILQGKGLTGSPTAWAELMDRFSGNPMLLSIVANSIQIRYQGQLETALADKSTLISSNVAYFIDELFARLSTLEQAIMLWLAIEREPVSSELLQANIVDSPTPHSLQTALIALQGRSLIEQRAQGYTMQNVLIEAMTKRLIEQVYQELKQGKIDHLNQYALMKVQIKEYIRKIQSRLILKPLAEQLLMACKSVAQVGIFLKQKLMEYRAIPPQTKGYFAGNILNLLIYFNLDLSGLDFSGLTVWQADLRAAQLRQVNFQQADLSSSRFAENFDCVLCAAFSPDGQRLATGTGKGEVHIWKIQDGKNITIYQGHNDWIVAVVYSPDSRLLFSGCEGGLIRVWDTKTGFCLQTSSDHAARVQTLAISPDGRTLLSGGQDNMVRVWRVDYPDHETSIKPCYLKSQAVLSGHSQSIWGVTFHPDNQHFASGSHDGTIRLWQMDNYSCIAVWKAHQGWATVFEFSPDGTLLASGGEDGLVKLWNVNTQSCAYVLEGHTNFVWTGSFSPNGKLLVTGGRDSTLRVWNVQTGKQEKQLSGHTGWVKSVQFSSDGQYLVSSGADKSLRLWDTKRWRCTQFSQGQSHWIRGLAFSPDKQTLVSCGDDRLVRLWHLSTGRCYHTLEEFQQYVWAIACHNERLAVGNGHLIWLYQQGSWQHVKTLKGHDGFITRLAFSPDGQQLVSVSDDNTVRLWDMPTNQHQHTLLGHENWLWDATFSPDGQLVASGGFDKTIRLWRVCDGQCLHILRGHTDIVYSVAFNATGTRLVSASSDRTVRIWDMKTGQCERVFEGHNDQVTVARFSSHDNRLISCSVDQTVRLWNAHTGQCLKTLTDHQAMIWTGANSFDRHLFASACTDEIIRIWNSETGELVQTLSQEGPYAGMCISQAVGLTAAQRSSLKKLGAIDGTDDTIPM